MESSKRTHVYVDGLNLYKRALEGKPALKWLDLVKLFDSVLAPMNVTKVHYFTTEIIPTYGSDPTSPLRHRDYLRALKVSNKKLLIHFGRFQKEKTYLRIHPFENDEISGEPKTTKIFQLIEKQSDVNLASRMVAELLSGECEIAYVVTNDSDHVGQLKMLINEFGKDIGLVFPTKEGQRDSKELKSLNFREIIQLDDEDFLRCQLPEALYDKDGQISRPEKWVLNSEGPISEAF